MIHSSTCYLQDCMDKTTPAAMPINWEHKRSITFSRERNSWECSEQSLDWKWKEILPSPRAPMAPSSISQLRLRCLNPSPEQFHKHLSSQTPQDSAQSISHAHAGVACGEPALLTPSATFPWRWGTENSSTDHSIWKKTSLAYLTNKTHLKTSPTELHIPKPMPGHRNSLSLLPMWDRKSLKNSNPLQISPKGSE